VRATRRAVESSDRTVLVGQFAQEALDALVDLVADAADDVEGWPAGSSRVQSR